MQDSYQKLDNIDNKSCTVKIIDTGDFELCELLYPEWLDNPDGAIFVYDPVSKPSFKILYDSYLPKFASTSERAPITLVGNKKGRSPAELVSAVEGRELADKYEAAFFEISMTSAEEVQRVVVDHIRRVRKTKGQPRPLIQKKLPLAPAAIEATTYQKQPFLRYSKHQPFPRYSKHCTRKSSCHDSEEHLQGRGSSLRVRSSFDETETIGAGSWLRWVCGIW
jgi:GTPase SAR1 family protein